MRGGVRDIGGNRERSLFSIGGNRGRSLFSIVKIKGYFLKWKIHYVINFYYCLEMWL